MIEHLETERLVLRLLDESDALFIQELVNSAGWLRFIGDRKVHSREDALAYINRITSAPLISYWTVMIRGREQRIGIITLIKRDYLAHYDLGFAFLPAYEGKGYAYEASQEVISYLNTVDGFDALLAITIPDNEKSIKLLKKIGFGFIEETEQGTEKLHVFKYEMKR